MFAGGALRSATLVVDRTNGTAPLAPGPLMGKGVRQTGKLGKVGNGGQDALVSSEHG